MNVQIGCLASLICAVFCALQADALAQFHGLGYLPGTASYSQATDISADGSTVVGSSGLGAPAKAFIWDATNGLRALGSLPDSLGNGASAVSADGSIVAGTSATSYSERQPFIWDAAHGMTGLGPLPGWENTIGSGVSNDGRKVAGYAYNDPAEDTTFAAFVWDAANGMELLGDLPGGVASSGADAISGDGITIVGTSQSGSGAEAFIWDAVSGMRGLGDLPGGSFSSSALDVSNDGSVVVGFSNSATNQEAFIWDAANGMRGLGSLPGSTAYSIAYAVSGNGSIVGGRTADTSSQNRAFIWDAANGMRRLDEVLIGLGADLTGWNLTTVLAISDDGLAFAGTGVNRSGQFEAWYAVIPEPSTGLLLGAGLVGLASRRRLPS